MPINIGAVEVTLQATDNISPSVKTVSQAIVDLRDKMAALGTEGTPQWNYLKSQIDTLIPVFERLTGVSAETGAAIEKIAPAAGTAEAATARLTEVTDQATIKSLIYARAMADIATKAKETAEAERAAAQERLQAAKDLQQAQISAAAAAAGFGSVPNSPISNPGIIPPTSAATPKSATGGLFGVGTDFDPRAVADELKRAELEVKSLSASFLLLSTSARASDETINAMGQRVNEAKAYYNNLKTAIANTSGAVKEGEIAQRSYNQTTSDMEGIATRLIERMILLQVLRFSAQFIFGVLETDDAMVKLSDHTGFTLEKIQELNYGAGQSGLKLTDVATALEGLNKQISSPKLGTNDALAEMHLSLNDVMNLNAEQRFDAIATALSKVTDDTTRVRLETELGLGPAIDNIIKGYGRLGDAARQAGVIQSDAALRAASATVDAYKGMLAQEQSMTASFMARMSEDISKPFGQFYGAKETDDVGLTGHIINVMDYALTSWWMGPIAAVARLTGEDPGMKFTLGGEIARQARLKTGVDAPDPYARNPGDPGYGVLAAPERPAPPSMADPDHIAKYLKSLQDAEGQTKALTAAQLHGLEVEKRLDVLDQEHAANLGVTTAQYKQYVAGLKEGEQQLVANRDLEAKMHQLSDEKAKYEAKSAFDTAQSIVEADKKWYDAQYDYIVKSKANWTEKTAAIQLLDETMYAKLKSDLADYDTKQAEAAEKYAQQVRKAQDMIVSYNDDARAKLKSIEDDSLGVKLANNDKWFDDESAKIAAMNLDWATAEDLRTALLRDYFIRNKAIVDDFYDAFDDRMRKSIANQMQTLPKIGTIVPLSLIKQEGLDLESGWDKFADKLSTTRNILREVGSAANANIFGNFIREAYGVISVMDGVNKALHQFQAGVVQIALGEYKNSQNPGSGNADIEAGKAAKISGIVGVVGGGLSGISDLQKGGIGTIAGGIELGSAVATGLQMSGLIASTTAIGAATFGIGAAAVGIYELFKSMGPSPEQQAARDNQQKLYDALRQQLGDLGTATHVQPVGPFGVQRNVPDMSNYEVLTKTIAQDMKELGYNAKDVEKEISGLMDTEHPAIFNDALQKANDILTKQANIVPSLTKAFDDLNTATTGGIYDQADMNRFAGLSVEAFDKYVKMTGDVEGGLAKLQPMFDKFKTYAEASIPDISGKFATMKDRIDADTQAIANATKGTAEWQRATDDLAAANDYLNSLMKSGQLTGNPAIDNLMALQQIVAANPDLIATISGSAGLLGDLGPGGANTLTKNDLTGFGQDAFNQMQRTLVATGGDQRKAELIMQQELQKLWEAEQKLGQIEDVNARKMLDQAIADGIVGEDQKSVQERIYDVLQQIEKNTGGGGGSGSGGGGGGGTSGPNLPAPPQPGPGGGDTGGGGDGGYTPEDPGHYAIGGKVQPATKYFTRGGPSGTDTVNAWMTPGEGVVTVRGMSVLGEKGLAAINSGQMPGSTTVYVTYNNHISAIDGASVQRLVNSGEFQGAFIKATAFTRTGFGDILRRTFGTPRSDGH